MAQRRASQTPRQGVDVWNTWRKHIAGLSHADDGLDPFEGKMAHDDLVCSPSVSACDHPACRLALCAFHAQLSRRRRSACRARTGCLLRNGAAMGIEIRTDVRARTSPQTPAADIAR